MQLLQELRAHIDDIASEYDSEGNERRPLPLDNNGQEIGRTRALIIASEVDGVFCAGADLKERKGFTAEQYVCLLSFFSSIQLTSLLLFCAFI